MPEPCQTPGSIPTAGPAPTPGPTTPPPDRFTRLIRQDCPEDPKRWALVRGTQTVAAGFLGLCAAAAYQVVKPGGSGDIGQGVGTLLAVLALALIGGTVAAHRKPDDPLNPLNGGGV